MKLRRLDLNLLVALDALLTERHVTRAGERIGLSQSAASSALRRLREALDDDILVRTPSGMEPTPRALEMAAPVRRILRASERLLDAGRPFDPATSALQLRLRMSDVLGALLLPGLMARLATEAPGLRLDIVHLPPEATLAALEDDDIGLAVSMDLPHGGSIRRAALLRDRMVCLFDPAHAPPGPMTLERFLAARHLRVSISPNDGRYVDAELSRLGHVRHVALNAPHWLLAPRVLRGSDLVAVLSERLARRVAAEEGAPLALAPLPFGAADFHWSLYWHRRTDRTPALRWLRARLAETAAALEP
ncbi:MAG: LysR family transcriptional regulator [Pseudomonadota bacterium]|nr:LysR family transcriptional regulator [Pseudomonadota bacterium]